MLDKNPTPTIIAASNNQAAPPPRFRLLRGIWVLMIVKDNAYLAFQQLLILGDIPHLLDSLLQSNFRTPSSVSSQLGRI